MKRVFIPLLLLAACAQEEAFTPVPIDMPVVASCKAPLPVPPPDLMSALPQNAALPASLQACLRQTLLDRGYQAELQAALKACR